MTTQKHTALITGASSGIGMHIARILAERGCDLIITARRKDRLEKIAGELQSAHKVRVDVIEADLALQDAPAKLYRDARALREDIDILVNNAGFGKQNNVVDQTLEEIRAMIQVNITSLTELTRLFAADMKARGKRQNFAAQLHWSIPAFSRVCGVFSRQIICAVVFICNESRAEGE